MSDPASDLKQEIYHLNNNTATEKKAIPLNSTHPANRPQLGVLVVCPYVFVRGLARILEWLSTTSREYVKAAISQGPQPIGIRVSVEVNYIRCEVVPDGEQVGMKCTCTGETESTLKMSAVNIVGLVVPPVLGSLKSPQWRTLNMPHRGHQFQSENVKVHDK